MGTHKVFGVIEKTAENKMYTLQIKETQIEWKLHYFITVVESKIITDSTEYRSPVFFIDDVSYVLRLFPVSGQDSAFMRLFLDTTEKQEYFPRYDISLKKLDGSEEHLVSGILKEKGVLGNLIKRSELTRRKSELLPHNVLTIICRFKSEVPLSAPPVASDKLMPAELIRQLLSEEQDSSAEMWSAHHHPEYLPGLDKLSENFKNLFGDKETCDTTLNVQDKEFKTHRSVLIARSSVFSATFRHDTLERKTGVIDIKDCDPDAFAVFLEYIYCGKLQEISDGIALNLYYISDKYDIQELKTFCVEYLRQHLTVENLCEVAVFADKYEETALLSEIQNFFNENASRVFLTSEWECFLKTENRLANKLLIGMSKVKLNG